MIIDLTCHKCDTSFEIEGSELIEATESIKCPNCNTKAPQSLVEDMGNSLGDLCKSIATLRNRFDVSLSLETDDLPAPYDIEEEDEGEEEDDKIEDDSLLDNPNEDEEEDEL